MKPNEADFVNEGLSEEEIASVSAATAPQEGPGPPISEDVAPSVTHEPAPKQEEPRLVDVRALQEARAAERELREQIAKEREERVRLEERTNQMLERLNKPETAKAPPSKEEDYVGFIEYQLEQLAAKNEELANAERQRQEAAQRQTTVRATIDEAGQVLDTAISKFEDVKEAFDYSVNATRAELQRRGLYGAQLQQAMEQHLYEYAAKAPRDPDQMAEFVRANSRYWGWQPKPVAPVQQQASVQELASRQERHMSLSGVNGGEPPKPLDAKTLANMSDAEFKKLMSSQSGRKQIEEIMGA